MAISKSKVVSVRLSAGQIHQAEIRAFSEGDQNVNAMTKRLLLEHLASDQKTEDHVLIKLQTTLEQNQFAAVENVRKLMLQSFSLIFQATGKAAEFNAVIQNSEREWKQIIDRNNFVFEKLHELDVPQVSNLEPSEAFADIKEDEIEITDLFSNQRFVVVNQNDPSQTPPLQRSDNVVNECKQVQ